MNIQWYPGHMAKTKRLISENLKRVDAVCEIVDARIPISSRNPDLDALASGKPRLILLNRIDLADPNATRAWVQYYQSKGIAAIETNSKTGNVSAAFISALQTLLAEKIARYQESGQVGRTIRVMVCGIPNVGKSTFINRVAGRSAAKAEDRPGVTRTTQWIRVNQTIDLMDTPGVLWPKFEDKLCGLNLAFTGAVKDEILDAETLAAFLMETLADIAPQALNQRYKIDAQPGDGGYELLENAAKHRGFRISGGEFDLERMSRVLLDEFRAGTLGRITLELPKDVDRKPAENLVLRSFADSDMLTEELP